MIKKELRKSGVQFEMKIVDDCVEIETDSVHYVITTDLYENPSIRICLPMRETRFWQTIMYVSIVGIRPEEAVAAALKMFR